MKNTAANAREAAFRAAARTSTPGSRPFLPRPSLRFRAPSRVSADDERPLRAGERR